MLFRILLIWLDSFDLKWNSHYDGDDLTSQFWQMEGALYKKWVLYCYEKVYESGTLIFCQKMVYKRIRG